MSENLDKNNLHKKRLGRGISSLLGEKSIDFTEKSTDQFVSTQLTTQAVQNFVNNGNLTANLPTHLTTHVNTQEEIPETKRIWSVAIEKLQPNNVQPRKYFSTEHLTDLSNSIKEKGILQPIVARRLHGNEFEIIAGERRWRAAQLAGLTEVPVIINETQNEQARLELAIIENIQRADLNPIEEAEAYGLLIDKYNLTQNEVAQKLGKERSSIANSLRLLTLSDTVKDLVRNGEISMGHAKVILGLEDRELQKDVCKKIVAGKLSVRATESLIAAYSKKNKDEIEARSADDLAAENLAAEVAKNLGTKVSIDYKDGKGKLIIQFYSDDQLDDIADRLRD